MKIAGLEFDPDADLLRESGFSKVYKAADTDGRFFALKLCSPAGAGAQETVAHHDLFLRQSLLAASLEHPRLLSPLRVGLHEGRPFVVRPYRSGCSLVERNKSQVLDASAVHRCAREITEGLCFIHEQGYRWAPETWRVLFTTEGVQSIVSTVARVGEVEPIKYQIGRKIFYSPEQVRGHATGTESDVFGLGCLLYLMATRALAFPGKTFPEVCMAILEQEPRPPSEWNEDISPDFERFLLDCLAHEPAARFRNGAEALAALDQMEA